MRWQVLFKYNRKKREKAETTPSVPPPGNMPATAKPSPIAPATPKPWRSGWGFCCGGGAVEIVEPTTANKPLWEKKLDTTLDVV